MLLAPPKGLLFGICVDEPPKTKKIWELKEVGLRWDMGMDKWREMKAKSLGSRGGPGERIDQLGVVPLAIGSNRMI